MASCDLLKNNPRPSCDEVRHGLTGNLCRCTGYTQIVESVLQAAENMQHGN
jgi:carbon-monoxide dehydrogenase small subunit